MTLWTRMVYDQSRETYIIMNNKNAINYLPIYIYLPSAPQLVALFRVCVCVCDMNRSIYIYE